MTTSPTELLSAVLPVLAGGVGGYLWHRLVGCRTGSCPLTANPWISTAYGAFVGLMIAGGHR